MSVRVAVTGAAGRMGRGLIAGVLSDPALDLSGATVRPGSPHDGHDAGRLVGLESAGVDLCGDRTQAFEGAQVIVAFTPPHVCLVDVRDAVARGIPVVVGSTGWEGDERARLDALAERAAVVLAPNFSVGVWVLADLVARAGALLPDFDAELVELHHRHKVDAPSGTALMLAEAVAGARDVDLDSVGVFERRGAVGPRPGGGIGVQSLRGGDATGEHTVMLLGEGERVELTHRTSSRAAFVSGALRSAKWVVGRPAGLYSLGDVLGG